MAAPSRPCRAQIEIRPIAVRLLGWLLRLSAELGRRRRRWVYGRTEAETRTKLDEAEQLSRRGASWPQLLGGVLPEGMAERVGAEFRWLTIVTSGARSSAHVDRLVRV